MWAEKTSHDGDTLGGAEAQTGNLVHVGMQAFHGSKKKKIDDRISEAFAVMRESKLTKYTGGDLGTAETLFHSWCCQEKKFSKGEIVGSEIELRYKWPIFYSAAEYSAYKKAKKSKPIAQEEATITGHVDELRRLDDVVYICDEKTGWTPADKMTGYYAAQIAAYVVGIKLSGMFPDVTKYRGYVKRTRDLQSSDPYYYCIINSYEQAEDLMLTVGLRLGEIAQGVLTHTPGEHCRFCPLNGFPACLAGDVKPVDKQKSRFSKPAPAGRFAGSTATKSLPTINNSSNKPRSTF
jgi:hypothetical protein